MLKCIFCTICILSQINAKRQISISPNVNDELEIEITNSGSDQHFLIIEKPGRNFEKAYTFNRTYQYKDSNTGKYPLDPIHFTIFGIVNNTKVFGSSKVTYFWWILKAKLWGDSIIRMFIFMHHFNPISVKNATLIRLI